MKQEESKCNDTEPKSTSKPTSPSSMKTPRHQPRKYAFPMTGNRNKINFQMPAALALAIMLATTQLAGAAPTTWNNAAGSNWSVGANWSTLAVRGTADAVIFGNVGGGFPNTNNITSETINSLTYNQSTNPINTTVINSGNTLTISSAIAAGSPLLL